MAELEHLNVTVDEPHEMARLLGDLFDWTIRWEGTSMDGQGYTVHVGSEETYLALYAGNDGKPTMPTGTSHTRLAALNHIGVVVDDIEKTEAKVKNLGLTPTNHGDYEPGKRFYFDTPYGIEVEIISYQ
ncbi:MAG: VOC family protein [Pseudomonadota bacterium]